jgi:sporulation protein YlmC with PRC-barrel domain
MVVVGNDKELSSQRRGKEKHLRKPRFQEPKLFVARSSGLVPHQLEVFSMRSKLLIGGLLASVTIATAFAQSNQPAPATNPSAPAATAPAPAAMTKSDLWRSSKLIGLNVYNDQNEKLGDIKEILLDRSGKVAGVVVGVGGFLGMGEHDIMVEMSKLKFVDEPVRTSSSTTTTTGAANRPANAPAATTARSNDRKWYPDHAILSGATKDQLKSMPQFKYS